MASKSTTKSKKPCKQFCCTALPPDEKSSDNDAPDAFRFCDEYFFGIKKSEIWKTPTLNRTKSTYFILPEAPTDYEAIESYVSMEMIKPTASDFEKFWFELSDLHKDRYLLVNYMVIYDEEIRAMMEHEGPIATEILALWNEKISELSQLIRGFVMEKNLSKFRKGDALSLLVNGQSVGTLFDILFTKPSIRASLMDSVAARLESMHNLFPAWRESFKHRLGRWHGALIMHAFAGYVNTYFAWVSYDAQNLRRYAMELESKGESVVDLLDGDTRLNHQIDFMRKLKLAAPRWSQLDRRMMLDAFESNGQSCRGTYVQILLNEKLVFGKQHFCAHCRRSSYIGENRMMACKRCDTEGVRPRAWYCDRECQKANWRQHRASKHPTIVVEKKASKHPSVVVAEDTSKHPAVVVEKKASKTKKRKPRKK